MEQDFRYLKDENICIVHVFAGRPFDTKEQIDKAFDAVHAFWDKHIKKRAHFIVNWTALKLSSNPQVSDHFAMRRKRIVADLTITTLRFTADPATRAVVRAMSIKIHQPSNVYASEEEALAVVRGIIAGTITVAA